MPDSEVQSTPNPEEKPNAQPEKKLNTQQTESSKAKDDTKAPGKTPYTGGTFVIIVSVISIIAIGLYSYKRNKDLKGI